MIVGLCREIKQHLKSNLNWLDRVHGLSFSNKVEITTPGKAKVKNLPFEWGQLDCSENSCITMDERLRAVSWFESLGAITPSTATEGGTIQETDIRMVCWVNLKMINPDSLTYDKCLSTLEKALEQMKLSSDSYRITKTEVKKTITDNKSVIGKYDFDDRIKLMLFPYFIFAVDFKVSFLYNDCEEIELEENCGVPAPVPEVFEPLYLMNSEGTVLRTISSYPSLGRVYLDDITAQNSENTEIGNGVAGAPVPVDDITITDADESSRQYPAGKEVTCLFPELELCDSAGALLLPIISHPEDGKILAPDGIVTLNGIPHTTVKSGGSVNVIAGPVNSGIRYADVQQLMPAGTSYQLYDYAWHIANGSYVRTQTDNPDTIAALDLSLSDANLGYKLLNNNLHGHKWRFTGPTGGYFDNVTNQWYTVEGVASNYETEVPLAVVYDHYTGRKYHVNNIAASSWASVMVNPSTTVSGETGWIACSVNDILSVTIGNEDTFVNRAMPVQLPFSSNTNSANTSQAYYLNKGSLPMIIANIAKTNNTLRRFYFKHF